MIFSHRTYGCTYTRMDQQHMQYKMEEQAVKVIMEKVNEWVVEYGLKVNEKKSKVVCINGEVGRRIWMMGDCCIGEVKEYKYLGSR